MRGEVLSIAGEGIRQETAVTTTVHCACRLRVWPKCVIHTTDKLEEADDVHKHSLMTLAVSREQEAMENLAYAEAVAGSRLQDLARGCEHARN